MTTLNSNSTIVLIPGHWLGAWAWDDVRAQLEAEHFRAIAVTLPGLDGDDPQRTTRTLEDQAEAIRGVLARTSAEGQQPAILVAHSGANAPVSLILDRHPELVRRVVWVDSGPMANGSAFAAELPEEVEELPLPPFDILAQQASLDGLSDEDLERFRANAVAEPAPVLRGTVVLTNDARHAVPTTLVCCSIRSTLVLEMARGGHPMFADVAHLTAVDLVDLPTGHWPMWSRAEDLAAVLQAEASRAS